MKKHLLIETVLMACSIGAYAGDLVTEQPAGTLRTFHGYSLSSYASWFEITEEHDGVARQVVFDDNGTDVWFKNPLTHANSNSWIKGTLTDGIITVETPQVVDRTSSGDWFVQRLKKHVNVDEDGKETTEWLIDNDCTSIRYRFTGDSIVQEKEDGIMLGMTREDGQYYYYGEQNVVYTRVSEKAETFPEGAEPEMWTMRYNNDLFGAQVKIVFDNDDIYIKGFWKDFPEACIKGRVEGDKVIIPACQYLGFLNSKDNSYYIYFMNSKADYSSMLRKFLSSDSDIEFSFDREAMTITPLFDEDMVPIVRYGRTSGVLDSSPRAKLPTMRFNVMTPIETLADVTIRSGSVRLEPEYAWGSINFEVSPFDADGNALDANAMSYSIWLDDEILVLDPEDCNFPDQYAGIDSPISEVPFLFNNDYGIDEADSENGRYVMFFKLGFTEIGVQSFYTDAISGKKLCSKITYINPETDKVRVVDAPQSGVKTLGDANATSVKLYDLNGRAVSDSYKGIAIVKTVFSDGSVKAEKKVIR